MKNNALLDDDKCGKISKQSFSLFIRRLCLVGTHDTQHYMDEEGKKYFSAISTLILIQADSAHFERTVERSRRDERTEIYDDKKSRVVGGLGVASGVKNTKIQIYCNILRE